MKETKQTLPLYATGFALEKVSRFDRISRRGVHLPFRGGNRVRGVSLAKRGFKVNVRLDGKSQLLAFKAKRIELLYPFRVRFIYLTILNLLNGSTSYSSVQYSKNAY